MTVFILPGDPVCLGRRGMVEIVICLFGGRLLKTGFNKVKQGLTKLNRVAFPSSFFFWKCPKTGLDLFDSGCSLTKKLSTITEDNR